MCVSQRLSSSPVTQLKQDRGEKHNAAAQGYWGSSCTVSREDSQPHPNAFKAMHSKNQRRQSSASGSRAPLVPLKTKMSLSQSEVEPLPFRVPRDYPHSRFSKAPLAVYPPKGARSKPCVSLPVVSLEKMPCFSRSEAAQIKVSSTASMAGSSLSISSSSSTSFSPSSSLKSTLASPASCRNQEKHVNGRGTISSCSTTPPLLTDRRPSPSQSSPLDKWLAASPSAQDRRPATFPSPSSADKRPSVSTSPPERKHLNGAKSSSSHRRVSGRVYDPNKHCGVIDPESRRPCTRSLTCKTHSLTHRRTVRGRKKDFDILLAEHKGRAKEKDAGQKRDTTSAPTTQSLSPPSSTFSSNCHNDKSAPTLKLRLTNTHMQRGSFGGGGAVVLSSTTLPTPDQIAGCQRYGADVHESSDEAEEPEKTSCHYSLFHPQPISWCAFSSRLMGHGHYVFDRHWDRIRFALHCMVEKHVNAQMWRKVPLVEDSVPCMSDPSSLTMPLLPSSTPSIDSISSVSCSTSVSQNGRIFCFQESKLQLNKTAKSLKTSADRVLLKKLKPPAVAEKKSESGYHPSCHAHNSNATAALSVRSKPSQPGGSQVLSNTDRYTSIELNLPPAPKGKHGAVLSQRLQPCGSTKGHKRKTSGCDRVGKMTKTTVHNEIFQKSSTALLSSAAEASHSTLSRLVVLPYTTKI
ncbi:ataxin-7-like protein 1 isoform X3 [Silurus meridionalis]|uniref:ataxin-7-like protein 1 isoform X3 n=1 Tax=Silurus meridionalis TaxID=175797 RepID=UPI001EEA800D|nr:ataxin-7-like protein 1 isoform X3 [Silurus meridionalis]